MNPQTPGGGAQGVNVVVRDSKEKVEGRVKKRRDDDTLREVGNVMPEYDCDKVIVELSTKKEDHTIRMILNQNNSTELKKLASGISQVLAWLLLKVLDLMVNKILNQMCKTLSSQS
ncbi:hypothetical protein TELCIR_26165 [Teladorsagia circumcincta]|uniref:Uncharacterized protein n=1 Tax=Teladorsagia circumcincta TaxID=45464 RepID=A0A2G9T3K6_TELCI|nr:hypothetical protein TELCIR_26165 [Teladorsagia circumcincta]